ncbi:MAG: L-threonylcarbamoyladenylate synthase, partial [Armatimonadetes bacterium]|nr:L-threonylcarbamoyladenylate synthase [Armatimonadota bacterium]
MATERLVLRGEEEHDLPLVQRAAEIIRAGGLVAFPTETVYGLGADALNREAVRKIFQAKGRPSWDPLIVHLDDPEQMFTLTRDQPASIRALMQHFMPGPLTLVLFKTAIVPDEVTAGLPTVALRVPAHPIARALIRLSDTPIAAPSANKFGRPSPTTAEHVLHDLDGEIDAVLDGGGTPVGVESTVLDLTTHPPTLLRPGATPVEAIEALVGAVHLLQSTPAEGEALRSPGMSARHYAPQAQVLLCPPSPDSLYVHTQRALHAGATVGVMKPIGWQLPSDPRLRVYTWGEWGDWRVLAQRLFDGLRWLESEGVQTIVCPLPPPQDL